MDVERGRDLLRPRRAALGIAERGEFIRLGELVEVRAIARPRDAAQQHRAIREVAEGRHLVSEQTGERAIRLPALALVLERPHLRLDVIHADLVGGGLGVLLVAAVLGHVRRVSRAQHGHARVHVEVVVNLVIKVEVRRARRDGMRAVDVVEGHLALEPLRLPMHPRAADDGLPILHPVLDGLGRHRRRVEDDHAAAALEERLEAIAQRAFRKRPAVLREHHEHVRLGELLGGGEFKATIHLHAALGEERGPLAEEARVRVDFLPAIGLPAANEHAQRFGGGRGDGQPGGEEGK